jgi:hypothetical protein
VDELLAAYEGGKAKDETGGFTGINLRCGMKQY